MYPVGGFQSIKKGSTLSFAIDLAKNINYNMFMILDKCVEASLAKNELDGNPLKCRMSFHEEKRDWVLL